MPIINVIGHRVNVDIEEELRQYSWNNVRWNGTKLIASSPFRDDNAPSFFVNLETGGWLDSGAYGSYYEKGNLVKLLAYMRGESERDTADYLLDKYGAIGEIRQGQRLKVVAPKMRAKTQSRVNLNDKITVATSPYLHSRGISSDTQKRFSIGYNPQIKGYTALAWQYSDTGVIANVKYRNTRNKRFFYEADAEPIGSLVYGLYQAQGSTSVVICEGEIDALSWFEAGITAVATGSANMTDRQAELIVQAGFSAIYLGGDNDEQGRVFNRQMRDKLRGYARIYSVNYGEEKDANDALIRRGVKGLRRIYDKAMTIKTVNLSRSE